MTKRKITKCLDLDLDSRTLAGAIAYLQDKIEDGVNPEARLSLGADEGFFSELLDYREETDSEYQARLELEKKWAAQRVEAEYKTFLKLKDKFENVKLESFL